ncbi:Uncharacterized protein PBTT_09860 [Plasmodiophora brassicae]
MSASGIGGAFVASSSRRGTNGLPFDANRIDRQIVPSSASPSAQNANAIVRSNEIVYQQHLGMTAPLGDHEAVADGHSPSGFASVDKRRRLNPPPVPDGRHASSLESGLPAAIVPVPVGQTDHFDDVDGDGDDDDDDDDDTTGGNTMPAMHMPAVSHAEPSTGGGAAVSNDRTEADHNADLKGGLRRRDLVQAVRFTVQQVIGDLKENHFLRPSMSSASTSRNQGYYRHWITIGVRNWVTILGPHKHSADFNEFAKLILTMQKSGSPETAWGLDVAMLQKLFWLSGAGFTVHDRTLSWAPRMMLTEFCLILLWLGPANLQNVISASDAIAVIYSWITASKDRVNVFQGMCSRQSAVSTVRFSAFQSVYHLNEGRMECGREFPADFRIEFFCRNLVCTSETPGPASGDDKTCGSNIRHDLMVDITRVPNDIASQKPPAQANPRQEVPLQATTLLAGNTASALSTAPH